MCAIPVPTNMRNGRNLRLLNGRLGASILPMYGVEYVLILFGDDTILITHILAL